MKILQYFKKIKLLSLFKRKQPPTKVDAEIKKNPYELVWYRQGWSEQKTAKNNSKFWEWEWENNSKNYNKNNG